MMVEQARKTLGIPLEVPFKNLFEAENPLWAGCVLPFDRSGQAGHRQRLKKGQQVTFAK
jgi:hypothetical protein